MDTARLRSLIEESAKTQKEIAADLGLSQQRFNYYVNGQREPDIATIKQLAIYFNVSIDFLFGLTDDPCFSGGSLAAFIRMRRGEESEESFAQRCRISVYLLRRIENGFRKVDTGDYLHQINSLSTEDMKSIADALNEQWEYIAALYDGYNPKKINGVKIPKDDRTSNLSHQILHDIKHSSVSPDALLIAAAFDQATSKEKETVRVVLSEYITPPATSCADKAV